MNLQKTFCFGKVDYYGRGRRVNKVDVDVRLYDKGDGRVVLGITGGLWNGRGTDYVHCGQCLDAIAGFVKDPLFLKIYGWWKSFHNNDMHFGNETQEAYLKAKGVSIHDYDAGLAALKEAGLDRDEAGYEYGARWHWHPIPESVLSEIKKLLSEGENAAAPQA